MFWRAFSFLLALGLFLSGAYLFYVQLFHEPEWRGLLVLSTGLLMLMGTAWLYTDFIQPLLGRKDEE